MGHARVIADSTAYADEPRLRQPWHSYTPTILSAKRIRRCIGRSMPSKHEDVMMIELANDRWVNAPAGGTGIRGDRRDGEEAARAYYAPASGSHQDPDGPVYTQSNLAPNNRGKTWQSMLTPPN